MKISNCMTSYLSFGWHSQVYMNLASSFLIFSFKATYSKSQRWELDKANKNKEENYVVHAGIPFSDNSLYFSPKKLSRDREKFGPVVFQNTIFKICIKHPLFPPFGKQPSSL